MQKEQIWGCVDTHACVCRFGALGSELGREGCQEDVGGRPPLES